MLKHLDVGTQLILAYKASVSPGAMDSQLGAMRTSPQRIEQSLLPRSH
jgi:hypothetical protein